MVASIFAGVAGLVFLIISLVFTLLCFVFWIWMLVDCIQNQGLSSTEKIVWVLVIIFLHALGALIYFLVGRRR
jgi:cytochrome c oxidase assembly factor CtaG